MIFVVGYTGTCSGGEVNHAVLLVAEQWLSNMSTCNAKGKFQSVCLLNICLNDKVYFFCKNKNCFILYNLYKTELDSFDLFQSQTDTFKKQTGINQYKEI